MILDLTHTIAEGIPVYPGTPSPRLFKAAKLSVNGYRETQLNMVSHTATHMDAPSHMLQSGSSLDELPVSQFCGRAVVVDVSDREAITVDYLKGLNGLLRSVDFVLFYTGWEKRWPDASFYENGYACPDAEAAKYLVSCGLKGVGTESSGWAVDELEEAVAAGITDGSRPRGYATREEAAIMVLRAAGK